MINKLLKQLQLPNMEPISGMDATFLYGESATSPMHVGSVSIIEGSLKYETFKATVESRLHMMPILRKRLVQVPFSVDYPYWVDDPNFDINLHMNHVALPEPGDWKQLRKMASNIFSKPLDHERPLWSYTFVEGLNNLNQVPKGSVALISKMHHVAVDGVAGAGLLSMTFDMSPKAKEIPKPKPFKAKQLPNELQVVTRSAISFAKNPLKFPGLIKDVVSSTIKTGMLSRVQHLDLPTSPFTAPSTPFNGIISAQKKWNTSILSLGRIKKLKGIMGVTVNDLVLAICAGALRRYLVEKDKLPAKPLVAMVPISTRQESQKENKGNKGNKVSAMLVQLATNIEDPIERLETIYENTTRGKTYQGALGAKSIANLGEVVPYGIANQAAKIYSRYSMAKMHKPVFNLVITNVPGPQSPLYIQGHKLHSVMATAPILDGMGLMIAVLSYNGSVTISPTSDVKSMPDLNVFSNYIRESANELEKVILAFEKTGKKKKKKTTGKKPAAKSDILFETLKKYIKANPKFIRPDSGLFQFNVSGTAEATWQLNFNKPPGSIRRGKAMSPDATFSIKDEHLLKIAEGKLQMQTAVVQGRLSISGDMSKAMTFGKIMAKIMKETKGK